MAFALASHEFGLLFEALADGMKSKNVELFSACLVSATWLVHMLSSLPDTGIRGAARVCLLKRYISILKSSRSAEDKALAMLGLRSFINDPGRSRKCLEFFYHEAEIRSIVNGREIMGYQKNAILLYDVKFELRLRGTILRSHFFSDLTFLDFLVIFNLAA